MAQNNSNYETLVQNESTCNFGLFKILLFTPFQKKYVTKFNIITYLLFVIINLRYIFYSNVTNP